MDSLTQIVLGAACGEVALGKKIGNKAMLWGAIGGTIPDLDIFIGDWIYNDRIYQETFHRGFMHSILFALLMSIVLGVLFYELNPKKYKIRNQTAFKDWWWLWFLAIFTHLILDCFTAYGTQLFAPFSDYRVIFGTIAVVDPCYTIPFLLFILLAMFFKRTSRTRKLLHNLGIGVSSLYLLFAVFNKLYVEDVFKKNLKEQKIKYQRFTTTPTLFNNILWWGTVETEDAYYMGEYSIFDSQPISFVRMEKNHQLLAAYDETKEMYILKWFTSGYYTLQELEKDKKYRFDYIKYGLRTYNGKTVPAFGFDLHIDQDKITMEENYRERELEKENKGLWEVIKEDMRRTWIRIQGN